MTTDIKEYNKEAEDLFIQFLYSDPETFVRVKNIVSPSFFENLDNKKVVEFLLEFVDFIKQFRFFLI